MSPKNFVVCVMFSLLSAYRIDVQKFPDLKPDAGYPDRFFMVFPSPLQAGVGIVCSATSRTPTDSPAINLLEREAHLNVI